MKIVLYILIVFVSLLIPVEKADIAKLQPVEAVVVRNIAGTIEVFTDTAVWGSGDSVQEALADLKNNATGYIYLDTARYLLVNDERMINDMRNELKGNIRLAMCDAEENIEDVVNYLEVHGNLPELKKWRPGDRLPEYKCKKL